MARKRENVARTENPPEYSEGLAALVCSRVAKGESLEAACRVIGQGLAPDVIYLWLFRSAEFVIAWREAKRSAMYKYLEDTIEIADDESGDTYTDFTRDGDKIEKPNNAKVNRDKLKIQTRQWAMEAMNREVFGEPVRPNPGEGGETKIIIEGGLRARPPEQAS